MTESPRPITIVIAAMGGEGGGVLTDWVVKAAEHAGFLVQSTSIPGVAQRTGATTYYVEIFPVPISDLDGREPVFALYPAAGDIDVMIASELLEAARAIQNGFVSPDRTALIASTHRVYTIGERSDMADGRLDEERLFSAAQELSKHAVIFDFRRVAEEAGSVLNAVLLGALAATPALPVIKRESFVAAIRGGGKAISSNLAGFEAGANQAQVSVNGIGERAGNAAYEEVVMAAIAVYNADLGIDTSRIMELSSIVEDISGIATPPNKAVVGDNAFSHESGIHAAGVIENSDTFEPGVMTPEMVGARRQFVLGKHTGTHAVRMYLRDAGFEVIYTGIRQTPEMIVQAAIQEDVDAIGLSILSGAHLDLFPLVIDGLNENDMGHIPIFCGGIIPKEDYQALYDIGVKGVFGPGTTLQTIIDFINELPAKE